MAGPTFSCGRLTAGRTEVPIPINPSSRLRQPTSFTSVLTAAPIFLSVLVGGGGGVRTIAPSPTAAILSVSAAATSATKSCAVLVLQVPITAPVPGSPVGCLCSDTIKFPLFFIASRDPQISRITNSLV